MYSSSGDEFDDDKILIDESEGKPKDDDKVNV